MFQVEHCCMVRLEIEARKERNGVKVKWDECKLTSIDWNGNAMTTTTTTHNELSVSIVMVSLFACLLASQPASLPVRLTHAIQIFNLWVYIGNNKNGKRRRRRRRSRKKTSRTEYKKIWKYTQFLFSFLFICFQKCDKEFTGIASNAFLNVYLQYNSFFFLHQRVPLSSWPKR